MTPASWAPCQLVLAQPDNQPHRADLPKMLVLRRARCQGWGEALMQAAEQMARDCGKSLLVLDTASEGAERLYARLGWQRVGVIPGYALLPQGGLCATTIFYRELEALQGACSATLASCHPRSMPMTPTITAFEQSPDRGRGLARDMRVRWALEEAGQPYAVRLVSFKEMKEPAHRALHPSARFRLSKRAISPCSSRGPSCSISQSGIQACCRTTPTHGRARSHGCLPPSTPSNRRSSIAASRYSGARQGLVR